LQSGSNIKPQKGSTVKLMAKIGHAEAYRLVNRNAMNWAPVIISRPYKGKYTADNFRKAFAVRTTMSRWRASFCSRLICGMATDETDSVRIPIKGNSKHPIA